MAENQRGWGRGFGEAVVWGSGFAIGSAFTYWIGRKIFAKDDEKKKSDDDDDDDDGVLAE